MTDKEINTNKYFVELTDIGGGTIGYTVPFPEELLREIIKQNKQLKRKEQECEELKEECEELKEYIQANKATGICETCTHIALIENDRYRKVLDEIENICLKDTRTFADGTQIRYDPLDDILDIIDKVKKE